MLKNADWLTQLLKMLVEVMVHEIFSDKSKSWYTIKIQFDYILHCMQA